MSMRNQRKKARLFYILVSVPWLFVSISYAQPVSSNDLIEKAKSYNNKVIEYQGELIGDVMARGDFAWINLNDGNNAIGIWGRKDLIEPAVKFKGGYNYKGDVFLIKGVFHRACSEHGGDLDIHLDQITKVKDGYPTPRPPDFTKIAKAIVLSILALTFFILYTVRSKLKTKE